MLAKYSFDSDPAAANPMQILPQLGGPLGNSVQERWHTKAFGLSLPAWSPHSD